MRSTTLTALVVGLTALSASAATFPDAGAWQPVAINAPDGGVVYLGDPLGDGANNGRDIVGDNTRPAFYIASNSTDFFFRLRLNTDPTGPGGLGSYGWGILIDVDGEVRDYDYVLMADGIDEAIKLSRKSTKTLASDPSELADVLVSSTVASYAGPTQNIAINPADAGTSGFGSNEDYYLDLAVPLSTLYGANPDGGAYLNFSPSTVMRFWVGVSNSSRAITLDLGGTSSSPGPGTMVGTVTNPQVLCTIDSMCGSATSGQVCTSTGACVAGCRGTGGNGCPSGSTCTSVTSAIGTCIASGAPVVTTPVNGSLTSNRQPAISGTAAASATINVYVDGVLVGTTTANASGAWTYTPASLSDGAHTASATATVGGSTSGASNVISFTVDGTAPAAPVVTSPANGSAVNSATPTISGTAEANATVRVYVDGALVGTTTANGSGAWTFVAPTSLAAGNHTVKATAVDAASNVSADSNTNTFTVDLTPPPAPVVTTPANGARIGSTTPTYAGTAEANSTVRVIVDGVQVGTTTANGSGAWSFAQPTALAAGNHTVSATATDAANNTSVASNTNTFTVDLTPPAAPVVSAPANGSFTNNPTPTVSGTAEANATVRVFIDGVQVGTTTANGSGAWTFTSATLSSGSHTVKVAAVDAAGNVSVDSNTNTFTIDTTPPAAPVVVAPANGSITNNAAPAVSGTAEANSTVRVFVDGVQVGTVTANASGAWAFTSATLANGSHTVRAAAVDAAGNVSPASNTNTFTIDTAAPAAPVVIAPANGARVASATPAYSGTAEANTTVRVLVDGVQVGTTTANASGAWSFTQPTALTDGSHTVAATATDAANNTSASSSVNTFTVDTTPPPAPVVATPANGSGTNDATPTISGTAEANATVRVFIDGAQVGTTTANASGAWTFDAPVSLLDGSHTVRATAADAVGNTSVSSNTNTFTVDTTAPAAPVVQTPANGSRTNDDTPTLTGTSEANSSVRVFIDGVQVGLTTANASGAWSYTSASLADGAHAVRVTATDATGNTSPASNTNTFTVDTAAPAAPIVSAPANASITNDNTPDFSGTAEAGSTLTVIVDGSVVGTAMANGAGAWSLAAPLTLVDGSHTVRATATDAAGNVSPTSGTNTFSVDTSAPAAPVVTGPANGALVATRTPTINGTAEANSTVTVFIDGVAIGTTTANGTGGWSLVVPTSLTDGTHAVRATSTDAAGSVSPASGTNTFSIDSTAPSAPVVTAPTDGSITSNPRPAITGTAEPGATVSVIIDGVIAGTTTASGTGAWTFTPATLVDGSHAVKATSTDESGNVSPESAAIDFEIDTQAPSAPQVSSPADGATTTDSTPTITGTSSGPGLTITVTIDGVVAGIAVSGTNGDWSLTAASVTLGAHAVSATATDAAHNVSQASATNGFTVLPFPPSVPTLSAPADGSLLSNGTPAFTGTAEAGSSVTVRVDGDVVCTTTASAQGSFSCSPTVALRDGAHVATASASNVGGSSAESEANDFTVDTTSPLTPFVVGPAPGSSTTDTTPTIQGTGEPGSTIAVTIDGQPSVSTTVHPDGTWTVELATDLALGLHQVSARATDAAGNVSLPSNTNGFAVVAPSSTRPTLASPVDGAVIGSGQPPFEGTAAPGAMVTVLVDGQAVCTATAGANGAWACTPSQPLSAGLHRAVAESSGQSSDTRSFSVDTIAPAAPIVTGPVGGSSTTDTTPVLEGTAEALSLVKVYVDGILVGTVNADVAGAWKLDSWPLSLGAHAVTAIATDRAGNVSPPSAESAFTIVAPNGAPVVLVPVPGSSTNDSTPLISGTGTPGASIEARIDGVVVCTAVATASGAWSCAPTTPLTEGPHAVDAREQGSTVSSTSVPFSVDSIAPAAPVVTSPAPNAFTSATPTLAGTAEPGSRVEVSVDGAAVCVTLADAQGEWRCVPATPLADGTHTVSATSTDDATNRSLPSMPVPFQVDLTAPAAPVLVAPAEGSSLTDTTPTYSGTAEPGSTITVRVDGVVACTAIADAQGAFSCEGMQGLPRGAHVATATATDPAGNLSPDSNSRGFTVVAVTPAAPTITGPTSGTITSDATPRISGTAVPGSTVTVRDADTGVVLCTAVADADGAWSCDASTLTDGTHRVVARAEKDGATSEPSSQVIVRIDTTPPSVNVEGTPTGPIPSSTGTSFTWAVEPETTYQCSIDGGAFQDCTAPLNLGGLPPGEHTVTVRATDAAGNVHETTTTWLVQDEEHAWDVSGGGLSCAAVPAESFVLLALMLLAARRRR